jgi:hypothetical protein
VSSIQTGSSRFCIWILDFHFVALLETKGAPETDGAPVFELIDLSPGHDPCGPSSRGRYCVCCQSVTVPYCAGSVKHSDLCNTPIIFTGEAKIDHRARS